MAHNLRVWGTRRRIQAVCLRCVPRPTLSADERILLQTVRSLQPVHGWISARNRPCA